MPFNIPGGFATQRIRFDDFSTPPTYFRPAPFWSINATITPEETARQVRDFRSVGLSGGFFHARAGLITEYMGEEWFAAMRAALQAAKETDGYLWLYDEDMWPSGAAGGEVTRDTPEFRKVVLEAVLLWPGEAPALREGRTIRAAYRITRDGLNLTEAVQIAPEAVAETEGERLIFVHYVDHFHHGWDAYYANLLHPGAAQDFIRRTHEVYYRELGEEFGKRIPGIFTDEPEIKHNATTLPWYEGLPALYQEWQGRDFWADLPYLFLNGPECRKIRLLAQRTISRQYVDAFSKAIYDWCDAHNLAYTGHYNAEDSLQTLIHNHSGSMMIHYKYQQIPGIDHLFRKTTPMLFTIKSAASVARQLGRPQVLSEIFGVARHTNTFADFKWIGNFDLVLGVNCFCPHLAWYTMTGRRKRDWPQNWNYQQTYWTDLNALNDYFTRLAAVLTQGTARAEILLLHSIESATAAYRFGMKSSRQPFGEDMSMVEYYDKKLRGLLEGILTAGYECDLGDEQLLDELAQVDGDTLRVGEMTYRVVVVPPGHTWRPSTYALLQRFIAAGGTVIFTGDRPTELDGDPAVEAWTALTAQGISIAASVPQLRATLERVARPAFRLRTAQGRWPEDTLVHHRADGERQLFFVVNNDREHAQDYTITFTDLTGPLAVWDATDGSRALAPLQGDRFTFTLPAAGAILLVAGPGAADGVTPLVAAPDLSQGTVEPLPATWAFSRSEPNALVMDRLRYSLDGGQTWSTDMPEYQARHELAAHFQMAAGLQAQPWVALRKGWGEVKGDVTLRYHFHSELPARTPVFFVLEQMGMAQVPLYVNGRALDQTGFGWLWDREYGQVEITDLVREGDNTIDVTLPYNVLTAVEPAYLAGDFAVRLLPGMTEGELVPEPAALHNGSWVEQGYPFYTGRMVYRATVQGGGGRVFLRLPGASGILYKARVNGEDAGSILWAPYQLELTDALRPGENTLEIEVVASRQNLSGPLHEKEGEDNRACGSFAFEQGWFLREEFSLYDFGLLGGAEIVRI